MTEEIRSPAVSRRRLFRLAAMVATLAAPASMLPMSARAQSDQAPATEPSTPMKKTKSKTETKTKKTKPGDTMAPAANPPKQQ
jgi:transglutaminase/protease-like cytokinesis protein 3